MEYKIESTQFKYSVAICVFNGEKFLQEQLESIVNQSIQPSEVVVIDDCSVDNSLIIVKDFAKLYCNISWKIYQNETNVGYVENFQKAIKKCSNEIIFLSDQDDYWEQNKAMEIINIFSEKTNVVFTNAEIVDDKLSISGNFMFDRVGFDKYKKEVFYDKKKQMTLFLEKFLATGATMAVRRSFAIQVFPIPKNSIFIHDSWLATLGSCSGSVKFITESLIKYRQHDNNAIGTKNRTLTLKSSKFERLLAILEIQLKKESEILLFLQDKQDLILESNFNYLEKRVKIYGLFVHNRKQFFTRLKILLHLHQVSDLDEFNTLRKRLGNIFIFIFKIHG